MGPPCSRQRTYRFHQPDGKALRDHHLLPDLLFRLCWRLQRYHRGQQSRLQFGKVRRNRRMGPRHWARDTQFPRTPQLVAVRRRRLGPSLFQTRCIGGKRDYTRGRVRLGMPWDIRSPIGGEWVEQRGVSIA